jgi:hypothetical protein
LTAGATIVVQAPSLRRLQLLQNELAVCVGMVVVVVVVLVLVVVVVVV